MIDAIRHDYLMDATWPEYIHDYIVYYLDMSNDLRRGIYDTIKHRKGTRPPYAPMGSPPQQQPQLTPEQLHAIYMEWIQAHAQAQAQQAPLQYGLPPLLGPLTSQSPVHHGLEYSDAPDANQVPPADADTKEKLLAWINETQPTAGDADPISMDKWAEMDVDQLRSLVRTHEGRVYTADSLAGAIQAALDIHQVPRDPLSRARLTRKNFRALRDVKLREDPAYQLPTRIQQRPPRYMELIVTNAGDGYYQLLLVDGRTAPKTVLQNLGFVPGTLDSVHTGSADYSSGVLLALLQDAWNNGKFLATYKKPFTCCRFHLGKSKAWWTSPGSTPVERLKSMIDEIRANTT